MACRDDSPRGAGAPLQGPAGAGDRDDHRDGRDRRQLTKAECKRLAIMANDGLARALRPVHAPNDGDTVFAVSTGSAAAAASRRS
jgi:hypothetical protein